MSDAHGPGVRLVHDDVVSEVVRRCPAGHPLVLRCHPVRAGGARFEPFPTLYWLVCPKVVEDVSRLEHAGRIHDYEERLARDAGARAAVEADHDDYVRRRWARLSSSERERLDRLGFSASLQERGIGGIRDRRRLKCLHLHFAHHLAVGSTIGRWIEAEGSVRPCPAPAAP